MLFRSTGNSTLDEIALYSGGATPELVVEWVILQGFVLLFVSLRTYARVKVSGIKSLSWDDLLVWVAAILYTALSVNGECPLRRGPRDPSLFRLY